MKKRKLIIDCDPGHDDAIAIVLAASNKDIELLGITIESGNQTIDKTAKNATNICNFLGINVPIAKGSIAPLLNKINICPAIHGESGLDGFSFPKYEEKYDSRCAANFIVDTINSSKEKVSIATCGPLTNVALALKIDPTIVRNIEEIVIMGGSIDNGNTSPAAEFNIMCDPEAAYIVFNSGIKVKMIGLNITRKLLVYDEMIKRMSLINNKASELFVKLMKVFNENQRKTFGLEAGPLHDPITIASIINDDVVTFKKMNVQIDINHGCSYGRTNCDVFDYLKLEKNVYVGTDVNVDLFWNIIETGLKQFD